MTQHVQSPRHGALNQSRFWEFDTVQSMHVIMSERAKEIYTLTYICNQPGCGVDVGLGDARLCGRKSWTSDGALAREAHRGDLVRPSKIDEHFVPCSVLIQKVDSSHKGSDTVYSSQTR